MALSIQLIASIAYLKDILIQIKTLYHKAFSLFLSLIAIDNQNYSPNLSPRENQLKTRLDNALLFFYSTCNEIPKVEAKIAKSFAVSSFYCVDDFPKT